MKRPTWATVVGILAIIFGILGVSGGAQEMAMPVIFEMQKELMSSIIEKKSPDGQPIPKISREIEEDREIKKIDIAHIFETIEKHLSFPDWYKAWATGIGLVSIIVAAIYLISGIFLLMTKPYAIKLFYITISISIGWAIIQAVIFSQSDNGILMAKIPRSVASVVFDVVLIIVALTGTKEAFSKQIENI